MENKMARDVTLNVGEPEVDVVEKQDGMCCNRHVGVPEEEVVGKQNGTGCNRAYGRSEEDELGKQMARWGYVVERDSVSANRADW